MPLRESVHTDLYRKYKLTLWHIETACELYRNHETIRAIARTIRKSETEVENLLMWMGAKRYKEIKKTA